MTAAFLQILGLLELVAPGCTEQSTDGVGVYDIPLPGSKDIVVSVKRQIRKHLREECESHRRNYLEPSRSTKVTRQNPGSAFGSRNGNVNVKTVPIQYVAFLNKNCVPKARPFPFHKK
ncbi:hypothetical protein CBL_10167 [Carabus blaptoides fortunei]